MCCVMNRCRFSGDGSNPTVYPNSSIHSQEMYQLSQYLKEALHREQVSLIMI